MKNYDAVVHERIRDLFSKDEIEILLYVEPQDDRPVELRIPHKVMIVHKETGIESICGEYESQVKNANIAMLDVRLQLDKLGHH